MRNDGSRLRRIQVHDLSIAASRYRIFLANRHQDAKSIDPIAKTVFDEMEKDAHSGSSAGWTIRAITNVAKDLPKWRHTVLENTLIHMKDRVDKFIENRYTEKFAPYAETSERWPVRRSQVLHSLEYSYLVNNVITEDDQALLQYLSKIENISHLENEVLIDMIQEELQRISLIAAPVPCAHTAP